MMCLQLVGGGGGGGGCSLEPKMGHTFGVRCNMTDEP